MQKNIREIIKKYENSKYEDFKDDEWEAGVDEAGRGPVIGPMVYGICAWPVKLRDEIAKIGIDDSK